MLILNRRSLKILLVLLALSFSLFNHFTARAQVACPPGMIPYGTGTDQSVCGADPSYQSPSTPPPPLVKWAERWGAIATYEPAGVLGQATGMASKSDAVNTAMNECRKRGGGSNCKLDIWYSNQCVAMVVSDKGYNTSTGVTTDFAAQKGMKTCTASGDPNCHVYYSACSMPERIQ
ncbi:MULTISPECIES: DUF4189 domain-containing protein [Burkholderia]|uniref:DUF4189 domain-containing protein n=1 Tax=Burkholderia contaminans TaxID=488447 RepID=A0A2S5DQE9_9BURK|nr:MULTISPECIES: DUF4189 domain-containing protein [Burkholderia]EKS9800176.1 DUF4189 domain-containing protein [Burkholderia cepacia]EKS9807686.1 DUF4189 domain-containing protein [Burkholderia cepacia]EKS9815326.1 DUF4189 domain-containing protein [Burkholderia cepacia]EKS9822770.1 DUF4189 domain-containing protein [Burkholderia cepacia]EKS9830403.1 DUF4189 domain-containing protein [Burkholderia cepacia]